MRNLTHIVCSLLIDSGVLDGQGVGVLVLESPVVLVLVTFHVSLQHICMNLVFTTFVNFETL